MNSWTNTDQTKPQKHATDFPVLDCIDTTSWLFLVYPFLLRTFLGQQTYISNSQSGRFSHDSLADSRCRFEVSESPFFWIVIESSNRLSSRFNNWIAIQKAVVILLKHTFRNNNFFFQLLSESSYGLPVWSDYPPKPWPKPPRPQEVPNERKEVELSKWPPKQ